MPSKLFLTPLLLPIPIYFYYEYLAKLYPTSIVPQPLQLSIRKDSPAIGMMESEKGWINNNISDSWFAIIPKKVFDLKKESMVLTFTKAFWSASLLKVERGLFTSLLRLGIGSFELRGVQAEGSSNEFKVKDSVIGGLFAVESHDVALENRNFKGAIVTSWWIKPSNFIRAESVSSPEVIGGYHSFSVETLPIIKGTEEKVKLHFVSHLILSGKNVELLEMETIPSSRIPNLSIVQKTVMYFHTFYARILMDNAVRTLLKGGNV